MKVVHIITGLEGGGAEGVLLRLVTHSAEVQHSVISMTNEGVYGARLRAHNIPLTCLGMPRGRIKLPAVLRLWKILRTERPDVVQTWMYHADLIGGVVARLAGAGRIVWGIRHSDLGPGHVSRTLRLVAKACALVSPFVPHASISCAKSGVAAHRALGYKGQFSVVANGYDMQTLQYNETAGNRLREQWGGGDHEFLIGMVGRFHPQKDHSALLRSLSDPRLHSVRCVLVGSGCDDTNQQLTDMIEEFNLRERVVLAGRRSDIPAVMSALNLHVLSAAYGEAFPNVLAEAMACSTPCVTTDVGDAAAIVGTTGWVVRPGKNNELTAAIHSACAEWDNRQKNSRWEHRRQAARKKVASEYSMSAMANGFFRVWRGQKQVLLVAPSMRGGGAERVLSNLARGLDRQRYSVSLALLQKEGPFLEQIPDDVEVIDLASRRARYAAAKLYTCIRSRRPDVVLSTLGHVNLLIAVIRPFLPKQTRLIAREANTVTISNTQQSHPRIMDFLYRRLYHRFDRVICQSRYMAQDLIKNYRVPDYKTMVIHNPVDSQAVHSAAKKTFETDEVFPLSFNQEPLRIVAVGRLVPQKGYDLLLTALSRVQRRWTLSVLGIGVLQTELREQTKLLDLSDLVRWEGFQSNPYRFMLNADVLLLPSRYEGLPNVVIEAGVLGLPVLAFDCPGGTAEIIRPGLNGELIACGDIGALTAAIETFRKGSYNPGDIRKFIEQRHSMENICTQYAEQMERL